VPHIKTNEKYYTQKQIVIYAILFPANQIYVGKTLKHAVKNHYKDHYILRNSLTKTLFAEAKSNALAPQMYLLEDLETTEAEAYKHCIVWNKYFIEKHFDCIAHAATREYAENLFEDAQKIYEQIRTIPLEEILCEEKILVSSVREYRKKNADKNPDDYAFIGFRVSKEDAEKIRLSAESKQRNISEYCRSAAVDGCVVNVDFNFLWRYMNELSKTNRLLEDTIYTIHETGTYHPQDLVNIQNTLDIIVEHQKKINEDMTKTMKKMQKKIRAARRNLK